jgi:hypothetical protein
MKRWGMLAITAFITGMLVPMAGQTRLKEWRVNGILISDSGTVRSLGLTVEDMEALTYGVDEIPSYECRPNPYNGNHTIIGLNGNGDKPTGWLRSHISRGWTNLATGDLLRVDVRVYDKPAGSMSVTRTTVGVRRCCRSWGVFQVCLWVKNASTMARHAFGFGREE